jgi:TPR repeat protein
MATLKALAQKAANVTPDEDRLRLQLSSENDAHSQCRNKESYALSFATLKRWSEEFDKSKRATHPHTADDFDAKSLSTEAMAKKGKEAYEAENYDAAMRWFRKAADLGNADAMMGISWIYGNGRGVAQDDAEALRWYKKSAELGNADAMERIGSLYVFGRGVRQDYPEAMRWLKKAADLGNTTAMFVIGGFYQLGEGVPKDEAQARVWMKKAAAMGDTGANMWLTDHP